ncbi:MAG: exopolysaccharide biosynthesis protein, partial [Thermostichales cyanobacterium GMQP_bins_62]
MPRLSQTCQAWLDRPDPPATVTLGEILQTTGESSFGLLLAILSFPSALPLPAPGYSTPFGVLIVLLALQWLGGSSTPWLPPRFLKREISWETWVKILAAGIPWLRRLERLTGPRWPVVTRRGHWVLGLLVLLMGISMILPIPGTNTVPALGVFLIGLGLIEADGVICALGS